MLTAIVRAGDWQAVTGAMTVMRVYARNILDEMLDTYALSFGVECSDEEWKERLNDYLNVCLRPSHVIKRPRAVVLEQVKRVWLQPAMQKLQEQLIMQGLLLWRKHWAIVVSCQ